jgi:xylulokinase
MPARALLGIDVGTSSAKGAAFDAAGRCLATAEVPYAYAVARPGWAEADAEGWWRAVREILGRLVAAVGAPTVEAVGVTGQAPTLLAVDAGGRPLGPAILWLDVRAEGEVPGLAARLPAGASGVTGNRLDAAYLGPKVRWLARHAPDQLRAAATLLQSHSFPVLRLTGARVTDPSSAALSTPLYDARARTWWAEGCQATGLDPSLLPALEDAHAVAGHVTAAAARETGLRAGTPVVVGGADFAASTLAAGVIEPGEACLMLGTAGNLVIPFAEPEFDDRLITAHHVGCRRFLALGAVLAGAVQQWFRATVAPEASFEALDAEGAKVPAGADGVRCLPYLQGERAPVWDAGARGAFVGLSLAHGRGHLYRSVLEAIAVSFRHCLEVAREGGRRIEEVVAVNGGARSALWRQILADALGVPLLYLPESPGAPAGAALLAGIGVGLLPGVERARAWRAAARRHEPDPGAGAIYAGLLAERQRLHPALRRIA